MIIKSKWRFSTLGGLRLDEATLLNLKKNKSNPTVFKKNVINAIVKFK